MTSPSFVESVLEGCQSKATLLVAGFDPRPDTIPDVFGQGDVRKLTPDKRGKLLEDFFSLFLEATSDYVSAIKPNSAFFEQLGVSGLHTLSNVIQQSHDARLQTILDIKRGDIGSTAEAYARAYLGPLSKEDHLWSSDFCVSAVTINPFLGLDSLEPFLKSAEHNNKGVFILLRTSNPGARDIQGWGEHLPGRQGTVTTHLTNLLAQESEKLSSFQGYNALGVVVGATCSEFFSPIRERLPHALFLTPGVGAQGGDERSIQQLLDPQGLGALVPVSRELLKGTADIKTAQAVRERIRDNVRGIQRAVWFQ